MMFRLRLCGSALLLGTALLLPRPAAGWTVGECVKVKPKTDFKTGLRASLDLDSAKDRETFINARTQCMSRGEPAIPAALLAEDKRTIDAAYPVIRDFYLNRNHKMEDVPRIVSLAWTGFRWTHPSVPMTRARFIQLSTSYGQLTVNSDPVGASIAVDGKPWDELTNTTDWTEAGERSVDLTKKGCKSETKKVMVPAGGSAKVESKLNCN